MDTVEVKTSELIGAALDWAVALADGVSIRILAKDNVEEKWQIQMRWRFQGPFWPSQDWSQCGPLIEKHGICILQYHEDCHDLDKDNTWTACPRGNDNYIEAPTPLIAACRVIVAQKLGETVSIPSELMQ